MSPSRSLSRGWAAVGIVLLSAACSGSNDDECRDDEMRVGVYCIPIRDAGLVDTGPVDTGLVYDGGFEIDSGADAGPPADIGPPPDGGQQGDPGRILVRGAAVLPIDGVVHRPGEVYIENGTIACVGGQDACTAPAAGASIVQTNGIVLPGFVDSHNHIAYNWLPEWTPGRLFNDSPQWRASSDYDTFISPYSDNRGDTESFCAMVQWGEVRALVGGTTTAIGAPQPRTCFRWLVRNAELSTGYNGWMDDVIRTNTLGINTVDQEAADGVLEDAQLGEMLAYLIHLGEGISIRSHDEYDDLVSLGLLIPQTVIVHGTALTATDFTAVGNAGAKLVWSPSSNIALYGQTTDIPSALDAQIPVALAPDWTPSGADDMLTELRFAKQYITQEWPGLLLDEELVAMATRIPAEVLGISQFVGTLEVGKFADIQVINGDAATPYASVIAARPEDVALVFVGGIPSYGDPAIMQSLVDAPPTCHAFDACGTPRTACWEETPAGAVSPGSIAGKIAEFYLAGPSGLFPCN